MPGNSFGKALVLTTFGESHGPATGGVLDGLPSGLPVDISYIQSELDRRRPGRGIAASGRAEADIVEILSGIYDGFTTGAPIAFLIPSHDQRPDDYREYAGLFRPSHADFTWQAKYGLRDPRGGGRASARETAARVAGGALAKIYLNSRGIGISAVILQIGPFALQNPAQTIDEPAILGYLEQLRGAGDTTGGVIGCTITGTPAGLGEPVFDKLHAELGKAVLGIPSVKGFEIGSGFAGASMKGSEHNDRFISRDGRITTETNRSGGVQGGISNGEDIFFRVAFKPVPTIMQKQATVDTSGQVTEMSGEGRHDVCVIPRALPVVESMAALVIADHLLRWNGNR